MIFNLFGRTYMEEAGAEGAPAGGAVAAPAAAPANASTPDPKQAAAPATEPAAAAIAYESTGNSNADYALGQIAAAGIGPDHPAALAALEGNFTLLKHALAAKGVPGSDHLVDMLTAAATEAADAEEAFNQQVTADVHALAGSKEQWDTVMEWGRANADEAEKEALNDLFGNPKTHKIAATYLLSMYDRAGGVREPAAGVINPDGASARAGARAVETPLNRVQFAAEAKALREKLGDAYVTSAEYQALGRRLVR
ncbi:hypothetical protein BF7_00175 [Pseudomonas phage Bf7]|uniref:Scaffolding protein n=1 Tax=Pseudomonas phage Bf7 TaxID=1100790 RepID=H2ELX1_9CAUD|nr:head scaffolding protein [Pseudomonas phage Bf7]AEX65873.1 hypothetical protein BF7_00175 [Pseudomonas phage Bf7]